jgi:tetratricopeptide (TPR) repeat protein
MKINEFGLAVQALEEAWAIKKSISFTVPQSFEHLLLNLAKCHYGLKDLNKAQSFLSQTIALIKEKKTYTEDLKPADEKNLMHIEAELRALKANICLDSEKLDSARNNFRKALKLYKKAAGKSNIILGELYEAYGKVNIRIKDIEKGKKCLLRSLTIYRLNLGESDMKTLEVAENIADLDFQLGEYEDCLLSYQELIDIYRDKHPEKQEEISDFLIRLGFINFKTSQYSEALENFKEAGVILLEMDRKTVGNSEKSAKIRAKFARIQKDIVRIEELL